MDTVMFEVEGKAAVKVREVTDALTKSRGLKGSAGDGTPVLRKVKIETKGREVIFTGTDRYVAFRLSAPMTRDDIPDASWLVDAKTLVSLLKVVTPAALRDKATVKLSINTENDGPLGVLAETYTNRGTGETPSGSVWENSHSTFTACESGSAGYPSLDRLFPSDEAWKDAPDRPLPSMNGDMLVTWGKMVGKDGPNSTIGVKGESMYVDEILADGYHMQILLMGVRHN